jgi:hypothetical protein
MQTTAKEKGALLRAHSDANHADHSTKSRWNYKGGFDRARLPSVSQYYEVQGVTLKGGGAWRDAVCPFHEDTKPSLRVRLETGAFKCMTCGARGGDVLAFHQQRHGLSFKQAAQQLGAWRAA